MSLSESSTVATRQRVGGSDIAREHTSLCGPVCVAEETPVGFVYNGFPYAVMMATPGDLEDFALGFSLTERIIERPSDIRRVSVRRTLEGIELTIDLGSQALTGFLRRRRLRSLRGHTSCGICGIEELDQVSRAPPPLPAKSSTPLGVEPIRRALLALRDYQPLSRMTHCAHAAAWAGADGTLTLVREDIGRHNALDKLIGACVTAAVNTLAGFCLVTSRCSFEMVQKAVAARMPALVAISAPTALAIRTAHEAGLLLVVLDRDGQPVVYDE
jgi:FdhD protein